MHSFPFIKAEALGNDFIILHHSSFKDDISFIRRLANRRRGVGFDQLIVYTDDHHIRFFNADGSEAEACGNGTRCIALYLGHILQKNMLVLHCATGPLSITIVESTYPFGKVQVTMPLPKLLERTPELEADIRWLLDKEIFMNTFAVNVGNPHLVIFMSTLEHLDFTMVASQLELHPFFERGANVSFVTVSGKGVLKIRVWERGVGQTLACGTAAYAASFAYHLLHPKACEIVVEQEGGILLFNKEKNNWLMTGEAKIVFEGRFY